MSSYSNGIWTHEHPGCPTCCEVRARQGFPVPLEMGAECGPCAAARVAAAFLLTDEYKEQEAVRLAALTAAVLTGTEEQADAAAADFMVPDVTVTLVELPPLDYSMGM